MAFKLNKYQLEVVQHIDGPCVVTSCPGSGKTATIVKRIASLIKDGIPQNNILCLTFTNKAASEMSERICKEIGIEKPMFFIGTFHSFCAGILRRVGHKIGYDKNFNIMDEKEQKEFMLQVSRAMDLDIELGDAEYLCGVLNHYRDKVESREWLERELKLDIYIELVDKYFEECVNQNMIDFSGLISETVRLIRQEEKLKDKIQEIFKYIMIDETQDTNKSQYELITLLSEKYKNIMLVGDLDQSIYGWRHARFQNIHDFISQYPNCKNISLSKNYRSTPQIIKVADKLIKNNNSHIPIDFETDNKNGPSVRAYDHIDQVEEAKWIAKKIKKIMEEGGWDADDIAILYRANKMSEPIEQAFSMEGIPYEVIGGNNFYDRKEIKDIIAMLNLLINRRNSISFHRICTLIGGIGNRTVGKIENYAQEHKINLIKACEKVSKTINSVKINKACEKIINVFQQEYDFSNPPKCLTKLLRNFRYFDYLNKKYGQENALERIDNIRQLIDTSSKFTGMDDAVIKFLQNISLISSNDKEVESDKVSLMTLHAAKGLEFPIVFLIGIEKGMLPHKKSISDSLDGLEEERRLCYVGITRAQKMLYLTWCRYRRRVGAAGRQIRKKSGPSVFLKEMDLVN